jgi:enoyl-CoA hydratase
MTSPSTDTKETSMGTKDHSQDLLVERRDGVLILTYNRPQVRNALTLAGSRLMVTALDELDSDASLGAAVLTGGGGHFCSGMDLKAFTQGEQPYIAGRGYGGLSEKPPRKPLIAAVEGYALAGGFEMALCCDLIVASTTARFGLPEVKRGLVAAAGGVMRLPQRIPHHIAMEMILTGDMVDAERAAQLGLVNALVEPGQALDAALRLAQRILANSPLAVGISKRLVAESRTWPQAEMFERQRPIAEPVFTSQDAREGALAFAEKRAPQWAGH